MPINISKLFQGLRKNGPFITIVSGLPRSGTSMMQKMLEAGGIEPLTDLLRKADDNNPNGYYEYERVKALRQGDVAWLTSAQGKSVKVISELLQYLPGNYSYRILFMERNINEVLASQQKMLASQGKSDAATDEQLAQLFAQHIHRTKTWIAAQPNMRVLYVDYNQVMQNPQEIVDRINRFLGGNLQIDAMGEVVDPNLYRQRKA
jgi:hypothetical protein